jgi:hypothetical protein
VVREKGGWLAGSAAGAEASDVLAKGGVAIAEAFGNVLLAAALDTDGAEGLVQALGVGSRLEEEAASRGVVHPGAPSVTAGQSGRGVGDKRNGSGSIGGRCEERVAAHGKGRGQRAVGARARISGQPEKTAGKREGRTNLSHRNANDCRKSAAVGPPCDSRSTVEIGG